MTNAEPRSLEPWLRGTLMDVEPVRRAVLHALELAVEDVQRWCADVTDEQMFARPGDLPHLAFQLRHIVRSLDRLLTYAEDRQLDDTQLAALKSEMEGGTSAEVMEEFQTRMQRAMDRILANPPESFAEPRGVGRKRLPTTVAGLLIHCAEHTQRHVGQMVTTVKVVTALDVSE